LFISFANFLWLKVSKPETSEVESFGFASVEDSQIDCVFDIFFEGFWLFLEKAKQIIDIELVVFVVSFGFDNSGDKFPMLFVYLECFIV
jgi:hypothetical protein